MFAFCSRVLSAPWGHSVVVLGSVPRYALEDVKLHQRCMERNVMTLVYMLCRTWSAP